MGSKTNSKLKIKTWRKACPPQNWRRAKLGEVANLNPTVELKKGEKYSFIPMEIIDGINKYVKPNIKKEFNGGGAKFAEGDILFARITPCLEHGKVAIAKELEGKVGFGSTEYFVFRGKENITDTNFLYYLSRTNRLKQTAINSMVGVSGRQRARIEAIKEYELNLPSFFEQKRIADILSAFDDKIELNNKINQTLEQMAQEIFKEWFVKFNFPVEFEVKNEKLKVKSLGYKDAGGKMVDSELGKIPEGWEVKMLPEVFDFLEGPGIRNWQYASKGCRFINIRLIKDNDIDIESANCISEEEANGKYKHFHLQERDMVVSTSGTLGRYAIVRKEHLPLLLNTSVIRFRPKDNRNYSYMYQFLKSDYFYRKLLSMASGSAQLNFGPIHLKQIKVLVPSQDLLNKFNKIIDPIYEKIITNMSENQKLAALRNLLLPKLMRGGDFS